MEAIILAGGFGTRLQSVIKNVPKPMADINGKPFLEYILNKLSKQGITDVILAVGYKANIIENYFKYKYKNINIRYSFESNPLGTGGAIKKSLEICTENDILVINGDTYFNVNLKTLYSQYKDLDCSVILSLKEMYKSDRYGSVIVEKNYVKSFTEKTYKEKSLINGGVYIINKNIFKGSQFSDNFSFESDFLEKNVNNLKFGSLIFNEYFIDIGIPEDYEKAKLDLL